MLTVIAKRLLVAIPSLIGVVIGLAIGVYFAFGYNIIEVLQKPMLPYTNGHRLSVLHPMDGFTIRLQISFVIALIMAAPVIVYQVWAFLAPALHKPEKRVVIPVLFASAILFLLGVVFFLYRMEHIGIYVSLFAIGHSTTMLLGVYFNWAISSFFIDAIIGLSVVYKALDNIGALQRWLGFQPNTKIATVVFGLFHGLGLATKVLEYDMSDDGLLPNLIAFNVEKPAFTFESGTRSCGRLGPASEGSTSARSSESASVKTGSGVAFVRKRPCAFA